MHSVKIRSDATYADIEALPEHLVGELIAGTLYVSPRPALPHTVAASELGADLIMLFRRGRGGPGGWIILDEPEVWLGRDVLVPDVAGWRRERLPSVPPDRAMRLAPDWLCEVLSPSTARLDRLRKLPVYAAAGVEHVWLVDPLARTVEVYRRQGETWLLVTIADGAQTEARLEPFEAVVLDLTAWWGEEGPDLGPVAAEPVLAGW
jgi:Uma2 family endonuclease